VESITITGTVGARRHRHQAVNFAKKCWNDIVDSIDVATTWFLLGVMCKHCLLFAVAALLLRLVTLEFPPLEFLDDVGTVMVGVALTLMLALELGRELVEAAGSEE
jgi:hypothetical protein